MKVILLVIVLMFVLLAFHPVNRISVERVKLPVYIDQPATYFDKDILYSEWPQEPTSSL